jgi:hypothetical protein
LQAGVEDDRADVPAGEREALREEVEVQVAGIDMLGITLRQMLAPSTPGSGN